MNKIQLLRYSRQLILEGFNEEKQEILLNSKVLVIGAGGLGSSALIYLAAAGVGNIGIVEYDKVKISDLNRQILYNITDINNKKVDSAKQQLGMINSDISITKIPIKINQYNISTIIKNYDIILECSDSLETKLLVNKFCYNFGIPLIIAGLYGYDGIVTFILPDRNTVCFNCLYYFSKILITKQHQLIPVIGSIPGIIGSIQSLETVKYLLKIGKLLTNTILFFSGIDSNFSRISLQKNKNCEICGV